MLRGLALAPVFAAPLVAHAQPDAPFIDAHAHIGRGGRRGNADAATVLAQMDERHVLATILAPPPFPPGRSISYGLAELRGVARDNPQRLAFLAGGDSLNPLLQQTPAAAVTPDVVQRFSDIAKEIAASGAAGFGELAVEHFSSGRGGHPYESSPPDHPLLLVLADIAANNGMPMALHMEAVPHDMPFPEDRREPLNPEVLHADIPGLERLLEHNPRARIVWLHAGWDLTGERTVPLMRGLLHRHPNLFMSIKSDRHGERMTSPFTPDFAIKPGWIAMLSDFPGRFVIGSDQFYDESPERLDRARKLVDVLPPDLAQRIGRENVARIYRLPPGLS